MKIRKKLPSVLKYGALLLTIILLLFPIYWMVICSLMPTHYLTVLPPHFVPVDITLDNYIQIAQTPKYVAYFRNSVIVAVGTVLTTLVLSVPAGYAFSRYRFRGKSALLSAVMSVQMFPIVVILASLYIFLYKAGPAEQLPRPDPFRHDLRPAAGGHAGKVLLRHRAQKSGRIRPHRRSRENAHAGGDPVPAGEARHCRCMHLYVPERMG